MSNEAKLVLITFLFGVVLKMVQAHIAERNRKNKINNWKPQ